MGNRIELTGLAGLVAIALPLAAMAMTIILLQRRRPADKSGREPPSAGPRSAAAAPAPAAVAGRVARPSPHDDEIARAEAAGDEAALAGLYLALARERTVVGEIAAAADLLRRSIRFASLQKLHETHGRARLELGDLERMSGDLTSACEHWQIARKLASDLRDAALLRAAEERMQRHGCPTDWVLNEF
jgi:tetratricopeptide (TPR) repeat protein